MDQRGVDRVIAAICEQPSRAVLAVDYDGTLAPIVPDPAAARPASGAVDALASLVAVLGRVAIITGRPARQAVSLASLEHRDDLHGLQVLGHYGLERWDAASNTYDSPAPAAGVAAARDALPALLASLQVVADIEDKSSAVAVHTRRSANPSAALELLRRPLERLAHECGLVVEPGRNVLELRPPGSDKGAALAGLVREIAPASAVVMIGDDLGDLAAFAHVERLGHEGVPGLAICSGSEETGEVARLADVVVDGPTGVVAWLTQLRRRMA